MVRIVVCRGIEPFVPRVDAAIMAAWLVLAARAGQIASVDDRNGDGVRAPKRYDSGLREAEGADHLVVDDWPEEVPITAPEVDVLETFLDDFIDALLRSRQ
jgi:hypothetical protein